MKKRHGLDRALDIVPVEELQAQSTGALLARLKRLRWCEESREWSDLSEDEIISVDGKILFKDQPAWKSAYADLKQVLGTREHVAAKP